MMVAACLLGIIAGVCLLGFSAYLLLAETSFSIPLVVGLALFGVAEMSVSIYTLKKVRVAWAFALSLSGTAFVIFLFTAPRIRDAAEVEIGIALLPSLLFGAIVFLYILSNDEL